MGKGNFSKEAFLPTTPHSSRTLKLGDYFFAIISTLDSQNTFLKFLSHKKSPENEAFYIIIIILFNNINKSKESGISLGSALINACVLKNTLKCASDLGFEYLLYVIGGK